MELLEKFPPIKMSCSREYPVVLGERHSELPKKTKARYILLPDCKLYRKGVENVFCNKCDVEHKVYKWIPIIPKCPIAFIDVHKDKVVIISPSDNSNDSSSSSRSADCHQPRSPRSFCPATLTAMSIGIVDRTSGILTYTITITNTSINPAYNVMVAASLPDIGSSWFVMQPQNLCQIVGNELRCCFEMIPQGRSIVIKVSASIRSLCGPGERNREVFSSVRVIAANAYPVDNESITIVPCL